MKKKQPRPIGQKDDLLRQKIVEGVLAQVPFDGWTAAALARGFETAGVARGEGDYLFPQGIRDVIAFFGDMSDAAMLAEVEDALGFARFRVRDKITFCVRARLAYQAPYKDAVRRMMIWYALPTHLALGVKRLYRTVDVMWRCAGDTATDYNFYTKRLLLVGVLKATVLFWLDDETPDNEATWDFLDRRIAEVMRLGKSISLMKEWKPSEWVGMIKKRMKRA